MNILRWILPVVLFFQFEIWFFFSRVTLLQWILLFCITFISLVYFADTRRLLLRKIKLKIKYFRIRRYTKRIARWARKNTSETISQSFVNHLKTNVFIRFYCLLLSISIFRYYPQILTKPLPAKLFLLLLIIYPFIEMAFRPKFLIECIMLFVTMLFVPYILAFLSHNYDINLFETLPIDTIHSPNIDINNLIQTANQYFFHIFPVILLIILFLIFSSVVIRRSLKLFFYTVLKIIKVAFR